jgi:endo-1,3(4)-beta-glucanase
MYGLPHHVQSLVQFQSCLIYPNFQIQSTTKGKMTAIVSKSWILQEDHLPVNTAFSLNASVNNQQTNQIEMDENTKQILSRVAKEEAQGDPASESNLDSMYFSGKALDKYACMCWVIAVVLHDKELARQLLVKLKSAFSRFGENRQMFPLVYESEFIHISS